MFSQTRRVRDDIFAEFDVQFAKGKQFPSTTEMKNCILAFGKKYNVVFSIKYSKPSNGEYSYICKHGGFKRETGNKSEILEEVEEEEIVGEEKTVKEEKPVEEKKKKYKKSTQKFECPAFIRMYNLRITGTQKEHNHPISQDFTTYAIHRKQSPKIMEKIYSMLAGGHKDPVTSVMEVRNIF